MRGAVDRVLRTINASETEIVRRIFAEYVGGTAPMAICVGQNEAGAIALKEGLIASEVLSASI